MRLRRRTGASQTQIIAGIAQSVEQLTRNEKVGGSIPLSGTILRHVDSRTSTAPVAPVLKLLGSAGVCETHGQIDGNHVFGQCAHG